MTLLCTKAQWVCKLCAALFAVIYVFVAAVAVDFLLLDIAVLSALVVFYSAVKVAVILFL